jgi:hypothetical protein
VPVRLHARWTAEALYRMWANGVSLVTWFQLRDDPFPSSLYQSGLYFRGSRLAADRPKPSLRAFRFPFVALPAKGGTRIWGRTPTSRAGRVIVEWQFRGGWAREGVLRASRYGIFTGRYGRRKTPAMRARFGGEISIPFGVKPVADRFVRPFGTGSND